MRRKSPTPTIDALRLLNALGLYLSAFVVDHDEMQTHCFEDARQLADSCESWSVLCVGHDVVRYARARRELALAQVGSRTCCPDVSICWEFAHESSVAYRRSLRVTLGGFGACKMALVDRRHIALAIALLCCDSAAELSCSHSATELSCSDRATDLFCCSIATEQSN